MAVQENGYIYVITNKKNGKKYVGQTARKNPKTRWSQHVYASNQEGVMDYGTFLHKAMRTDGIESFSFEVIEECKAEELNEREKYWIETLKTLEYQNGYNSKSGGGVTYDRKINTESVLPDEENVMNRFFEGFVPTQLIKAHKCNRGRIENIFKKNKINPRYQNNADYNKAYLCLSQNDWNVKIASMLTDMNEDFIKTVAMVNIVSMVGFGWRSVIEKMENDIDFAGLDYAEVLSEETIRHIQKINSATYEEIVDKKNVFLSKKDRFEILSYTMDAPKLCPHKGVSRKRILEIAKKFGVI